jgi:hypothetical protein
VVAAAGLLALAAPAAATTVEPVLVEGNPSCADLAPAGVAWTEAKLDFDPAPGAYTRGGLHVTITKAVGGLGWTSDADIDAVVMKGGPVANVYAYPGDADLADDGLVTPLNPNGGGEEAKRYGISHVTFCFGPGTAPQPETPKPESPQVVETPAAVEAVVVTPAAPPAVETEVLGVTLEATPAAVAAAELPRTGAPTALLAAVSIVLVTLGGLLLALAGRPTRS